MQEEAGIVRLWVSPPHNAAFIMARTADGRFAAPPVAYELTGDRGAPSEPTLMLDLRCLQVLMDDLWNAGVRPTEGAGTAGQASAMQQHIGDLRMVVTTLLPKIKK